MNKLLHKGQIIQSLIENLRSTDLPDKSKMSTKLMLEGQIYSALRFLSVSTSDVEPPLSDEVMAWLQLKRLILNQLNWAHSCLGQINDDEFPESV